jgi:hypothetical protein
VNSPRPWRRRAAARAASARGGKDRGKKAEARG